MEILGIIITLVVGIAGFFLVKNKIIQKQKVSKNSVGIQSGNDTKIK